MGRRLAITLVVVASCKGFFDPHGGNFGLDGGPDAVKNTPAVVNTRVVDLNGPTLTTAPLTIGAGDLVLIAVIGAATGDFVNSVQDTLGNTYATVGLRPSNVGFETEIWYAANALPGTTTVTVTMSYMSEAKVWLLELSGIATATPLDSTGTNTSVGMGTAVGASVTTAAADEVVLVTMEADGYDVTGLVAGDPFTSLGTTQGGGAAYLIAPAPGSYAPTWQPADTTTPSQRCSVGASFKPAP